MTDRYHSLTVVLTSDVRTDDAESIINAIKMIKGVLSVTGLVANMESHMAELRAKDYFAEKLWQILYPKG